MILWVSKRKRKSEKLKIMKKNKIAKYIYIYIFKRYRGFICHLTAGHIGHSNFNMSAFYLIF